MSFNDPKDVESVLQASVPPPATPALALTVNPTSPVGAPGLAHTPSKNATTQVPVAPPVTSGLTPTQTNDSPAGEPANPTHINEAAPQGAIGNTTPVAVGQPTLATANPVQAPPPPRVAGVQLVPPAVAQPALAGQLSQPANAAQVLSSISTMKQS